MRLEALRQALANPSIRRAELAWLVAIAAQSAYLVAIVVYAYDIGGVAAAGIVTTLRMIPAAVLAPIVTGLADRLPPGRVLVGIHLARALVVAAAALVIVGGLSPALVFGAVAVEGIVATLQRPTTMALMPALARSPQELVATNATTSTCEALGTLVGPAIGGLLLAVSGPGLALAATALAFGVAALIVVAVEAGRPAELSTAGEGRSRLRELLAGFGALREYPSAGLLTGLFCAQTFVRGILTVLLVAVSVELLGLGESGVGFLTAAIGAGGLVGAVLSFALVARRHLALPFSVALAGWGLPIALIGLAPMPILAYGWLALLGIANATLDVAGLSLLQRCVPNRVRGRVFGALESVAALTWGLGSLSAPLLVTTLELEGALIATGALLPLLALVTAPLVRRADAAAVVPHRQLELIRGVPMFSPLPMTMLEQIAGGLVEEEHASGVNVINQGESGDCWYLVIAGEVEVVHNGHRVRTLGSGDGFGEIALLSQRPRTATVATTEPTRLYRLPRPVFLEAVTGSPNAVLAGEELMRSRLAELGH